MRAMKGNATETEAFQLYFGCTESLKVLSNKYFQATRDMRVKQAVTEPLLGVHLWKPFLGILGSHLVAISVY